MPLISEELSEREIEILRLIATGVSNKEIAQQLSISVNTVKVHVRNIFAKINATSRTEAAMYAVKAGLTASAPTIIQENDDTIAVGLAAVSETTPAEISPVVKPRLFPRRSLLVLIVVLSAVIFGSLGFYTIIRPALLIPTSTVLPIASDDNERFIWDASKSLPTARAGMAVVLYNNDVYLIAGKTSTGVTDVVERYNPKSDSWEAMANKITAVGDVKAVALGGKIFVPGGLAATGKPTTVLEVYNPATDEWSAGKSLPRPIYGYALAAFEGKIYLFGGSNGTDISREVWVYDPEEDRWIEKTQMGSARVFAESTVASGKIFVLGGFDGERALDLAEIYIPEMDNGEDVSPWQPIAKLPQGRYSASGVNLVETVFLVGGIGDAKSLSPVISYSQETDQWQEVKAPPMGAWFDMAVVGIGARLYLFGGNINGTISPQALSYQAIYLIMLPLSP